MKKVFILGTFIFLFSAILIPIFGVEAQELEKTQIDVFYSTTCPHCKDARAFLEELDQQYTQEDLVINSYNIAEKESVDLLKQLYPKYNVPADSYGLVPIMFVADKYFLGFNENTGNSIKNYVEGLVAQCQEVEHQNCDHNQASSNPEKIESERRFKVPFLGEIDISGFSPLILSITVGTLDGFNACAMVALGFLLAVLVATKARKRVFLIGGTFILVSGILYFIFISAWLNMFMFLGYLKIITTIVSVIIILFALFLLRDYYMGVVCKVCEVDPNKKLGFFTKMQKKLFVRMSKLSTMEMSLFATLVGVAVVAVGINMVELVCSLGFPLAYTKVLTSYGLSKSSYYFYLLIYVIFYMIDDFIIFAIAVVTMRITKVSDKYLKAVKLISGIVLLALGILMLFKPELLSL
jgi:glutaredoxin